MNVHAKSSAPARSMTAARSFVDLSKGLVSRRIFFDEEIYRAELRKIFAKCWLFLGHVSQIRSSGDFVTNYMGEDPVIVTRDSQDRVRVFLNSCRHRGMRICRADFGNAKLHRCPFHGWTYSNEGKLVGVPAFEEAYNSNLDRDKWGLLEVPRVSVYGGLIFGNWDEDAPSLDDYLGDLKWYFDILLNLADEWEVIPGQQRYVLAANWKIAGENFAGDSYHIPFSHGSLWRLNIREVNPVNFHSSPELRTVTFKNGHGLNGVGIGNERYAADQRLAKDMGHEVEDYVEDCHRRIGERLSQNQQKVHTFAFGNMFPNFSFNSFSALRPFGLYLWHPRGPSKLEAWQWCAVDRGAPQVVKDIVRVDFSRVQATSGIAAQDDTENFEQVTEATRGEIGSRLDFNYQMGVEDASDGTIAGFPGRFGPYYSEQGQRNFYGAWATMMDRDG
jgi:phenylpropionate dioxygenase-like ring-hydroxylating dioxygenase large terminal subunit